MIEDNLKKLTKAIEQNNKTSIYEALEKYSVLGYIATWDILLLVMAIIYIKKECSK